MKSEGIVLRARRDGRAWPPARPHGDDAPLPGTTPNNYWARPTNTTYANNYFTTQTYLLKMPLKVFRHRTIQIRSKLHPSHLQVKPDTECSQMSVIPLAS